MPDSEWLSRMKVTMAVDVGRFMAAGLPPKAIVEKLFAIPEVSQSFYLYHRRNTPLALDPSSDEEKREIVDALNRVADWLDDGMHEKVVEELREIVTALEGK